MEISLSDDYTPFDNDESEMTLLLGARYVDGVVLIVDRKLTLTDSSVIHYSYDDKITGEIPGILTAFSGDAGAFEVFRSTLRDFITSGRENSGPSFDQFKLRVSQIQNDLFSKYQKYQYRVHAVLKQMAGFFH